MTNKQILESKVWYRTLKVLAYITLVASVLVPGFKDGITTERWVVDAFIGFIGWFIILLLIEQAIYYVVFGKVPQIGGKIKE